MPMFLSDVRIVLARPSKAGNVGAVCRAMKNMGLSRLRVTAPEFDAGGSVPVWDSGRFAAPGIAPVECSVPAGGSGRIVARENSPAGTSVPAGGAPTLSETGLDYGGNLAVIQARAVHALDIWEKAETFDTLAAAVKDCALVIGTTRRRGRHRKQVTMTPAETAAFLKGHPGPAALVFGNERTGLEDGELELCNFASHIPVDGAFPSLNLSHAVQIYAYELFQALGAETLTRKESAYLTSEGSACTPADSVRPPGSAEMRAADPSAAVGISPAPDAVKGQWVPLDQAVIEEIVEEILENFQMLGFYKQAGREEQERFFRDILSRAGVTEREGRYFAGLIARAARLALKGGNPA